MVGCADAWGEGPARALVLKESPEARWEPQFTWGRRLSWESCASEEEKERGEGEADNRRGRQYTGTIDGAQEAFGMQEERRSQGAPRNPAALALLCA